MTASNPTTIPYEMLANAMSGVYESIYDIDPHTNSYSVYYASASYRELNLTKGGPDFFAALEEAVPRVVAPDDRSFVMRMLSKDNLLSSVSDGGRHMLVYRIDRNGKLVYHQIRAILVEEPDGQHVLMGVLDVDDAVRKAIRQDEELDSERQKSANYLDAILATAAAYTDANLTTNTIIEHSSGRPGGTASSPWKIPSFCELMAYDKFQEWICDNLVCENREGYRKASSRKNLLDCSEQGVGRTSVSFSVSIDDGKTVPCRAVFYLYRERATDDVHSLCVIYDLTAQQRAEKEMEELKSALNMSRINNSASQMKPHFLYNALGSIQEVMLEDPERAAGLLEDFTMHLRGCIRAMDGDEPIPFENELDNIKAYAHIENMRLGNRLDVRYELQTTDFKVLPLSIQPLVENAIWHGIHKRGRRGGTVTLRTWLDEGACVVQVEDDGVGFDVEAYRRRVERGETDSTGIKNIRFRLEEIMGAHLDVESTPGKGTVATVRIPRREVLGESDCDR